MDGRLIMLLTLAVVPCIGCATMPPQEGGTTGQVDCPEPRRLPPTSGEMATNASGGA